MVSRLFAAQQLRAILRHAESVPRGNLLAHRESRSYLVDIQDHNAHFRATPRQHRRELKAHHCSATPCHLVRHDGNAEGAEQLLRNSFEGVRSLSWAEGGVDAHLSDGCRRRPPPWLLNRGTQNKEEQQCVG